MAIKTLDKFVMNGTSLNVDIFYPHRKPTSIKGTLCEYSERGYVFREENGIVHFVSREFLIGMNTNETIEFGQLKDDPEELSFGRNSFYNPLTGELRHGLKSIKIKGDKASKAVHLLFKKEGVKIMDFEGLKEGDIVSQENKNNVKSLISDLRRRYLSGLGLEINCIRGEYFLKESE